MNVYTVNLCTPFCSPPQKMNNAQTVMKTKNLRLYEKGYIKCKEISLYGAVKCYKRKTLDTE